LEVYIVGKILSGSRIAALAAMVACGMFAGAARAADFDYSGIFNVDNDVLKFHFTVANPSTVTVFSSSWVQGGFDPILSLWDASGNFVHEQDDGGITTGGFSNGVFYATGVWDSYYTVNLAAGDYTVAITQYSNFAVGSTLAQGFRYDGPTNTHFTRDQGYGAQPYFNGVWNIPNDPRTDIWAFHLLNVDQVVVEPPNAVPLPAAIWAGLPVLAGLAGLRRWRSRKA
jgi:hypothetical protein